jgi:hypothetical protein
MKNKTNVYDKINRIKVNDEITKNMEFLER